MEPLPMVILSTPLESFFIPIPKGPASWFPTKDIFNNLFPSKPPVPFTYISDMLVGLNHAFPPRLNSLFCCSRSPDTPPLVPNGGICGDWKGKIRVSALLFTCGWCLFWW